jgi:hypothetical protein
VIPETVQEKIEASAMGVVTSPIDVLEGVALFRMDDRIVSALQPYEKVRARCSDLYKREYSEKLWTDFRASLRKAADIQILVEPRVSSKG